MNVAGLIQLHEGKRHHKTDGAPLETPDDCIKHPDDILARELQPSTSRALASERLPMLQPVFKTPMRVSTTQLSQLTWRGQSIAQFTGRPPLALYLLTSAFSFMVSATAILRATLRPTARPRPWALSSWLRASYAV